MNIIANLRRLGANLLFSMCKLNEIQFSARRSDLPIPRLNPISAENDMHA